LRDSPHVWGSILERERVLREKRSSTDWDEYLNELDGEVSDETVLTSATSATSETIALNPMRAISTPIDQPKKSGSETDLYLGPVGADRPTYREGRKGKRQGQVDLPLILMITCLMMVGLLMVYSSSIVRAGLPRGGVAGNPEFFFEYQAKFMMIGIIIMAIVSYIPYQVWGLLSSSMLMIGLIGLILVFSPVGKTVNGAHRWIKLGINIQPIEFVKFAWILALCLWFGDRRQDMNRKYVFWCPILGLLPIIVMLGFQPDFGSTIIITFIFLVTFLISGGIWKHLVLPMGLIAIPGVFVMMYKFDHILRRLSDYLTVFFKPEDIEYNLRQALISFCSGRMSGVGLGQSSQKEYFLPEAHTDFILAIFGAEYGFIGVILLVGIYLSFFARCLYIARRSSDLFGALAVTMIAIMFCVQAFINMAMAIGLLPTKGLTLPLISYGGSSLLITCFSLGLILNVSRYSSPTNIGIKMLRWASVLHPFPRAFKFLKSHPNFLKRLRQSSTYQQRG
jgi:cell division protein FtsW